ncbi:GNAT family N-acetyltransferase [Glutamicibacter sp. AOP38-B1-38]|uniref:GNAT family N-acetyltransferase n=1 Tax=unclassified Glutamicibacter TaxID=2627139 RepID=UPI00403449E9
METFEQPVLHAGRYVLRPFDIRDVALIEAASLDPLIPLITSVPIKGSSQDFADFIYRQQQRVAERTGYSFAIAEAQTNRAVGQIGLWLHNVAAGRASIGCIGYWVDPGHRGRGAVSAAMDALTVWALELAPIHRVELYVEPWNEGSWRAAEKCGFTREGILRSWQLIGTERKDMYCYSRLKTDGPER